MKSKNEKPALGGRKRKIGLALGGGGARGIAHLGVLKVLEKNNVRVDYVAGSSMGALIGAIYCLGLNLEEVEKELLHLKKRDVFKMTDVNIPSKSLFKGTKIRNFINNLLGDADFSDVKVPFSIIGTDLATGEDVILNKGNIADAVLISISVPGIFPPVKVDNRFLIDGGISNALPVDVVYKMGADFVVAADLMMKKGAEIKKVNIVSTLFQAYDLIRTQQIKCRVDLHKDKTIIIRPTIRDFKDSFKFLNIDKFIKSGEEAAEEKIEEILKIVK